MRLYELGNLRLLHEDLKEKGKTRTAFPITINSKPFTCFFLADIRPFRLYLITPGPKKEFYEMEAFKEYCVSYVIVDYKRLLKYLGFDREEQQKFTQEEFLQLFNGRIPKYFDELPAYSEVVRAASGCRDIAGEDRCYFCGWKKNPGDKDVRYENYEKTRAAFGDRVADLCREKNVSSRWTADPAGEKMHIFDGLFRL